LRLSEDRISHLAHIISDGVWKDDIVDFNDDDKVLHEIKRAVTDYLKVEDEADTAARAARVSLFKDDRIDPVIVTRWKDIYEALEDAVDACETAASRVGNILVKNA